MRSKGSIPVVCLACQKTFLGIPWRVAQGLTKFCSQSCYRSMPSRSTRTEVQCDECSVGFTPIRMHRRKGLEAWFCGRECFAAAERKRRIPLEIRFWEKVTKGPDHWLWTEKSRNNSGYGHINTGKSGKVVNAPTVAWELVAGPVPDGLCVLHTCDIPACVRNDEEGIYEVRGVALPRWGHLFLGTKGDNWHDALAKGRARPGGRVPRISN